MTDGMREDGGQGEMRENSNNSQTINRKHSQSVSWFEWEVTAKETQRQANNFALTVLQNNIISESFV